LERELSSFTDLQKTLAQLGFNSGNILMRLSFRRTEEPLEEAMVKIGEYFKGFEDAAPAPTQQPVPATSAEETNETAVQQPPTAQPDPSHQPPTAEEVTVPPSEASTSATTTSTRPITVFSPPTDSTPFSAQIPYNENDYIPSIEHAKSHQRLLSQSSRPQRLPTDAEIAAKASAEEERRSSIREVDVKVRFPDQSQVVAKFGPSDTGSSLYDFVRGCLAPPFASEKFLLGIFLNPGASRASTKAISDSSQVLLIKDLGLAGRVLVNFSWTDSAASFVHQRRDDLLRPELRSQARELKVEQPPDVAEDEPSSSAAEGSAPSSAHDGSKPGGARKTGGVPKWLKLPGKK
jgi:tether containing UBX domain for GLUT4